MNIAITQRFVDDAIALETKVKVDSLRLAEIKTALIEKGPKEYFGSNGGKIMVIFPAARIDKLTPENLPVVRKMLGGHFETLFERVVLWKPVKSCRDVAARVLDAPVIKKFLERMEVDSPAQVRFS